MRWSSAVVLAVACSKSPPPAATGTILVDVDGSATRDAIDMQVGNVIEALTSARLRDRLAQSGSPVAGTITAHRRPDTTVIEVGVADQPDPMVAAHTCNEVIQGFIDFRVEQRIEPMREQQMALAAQLDKLGSDDPQRAKLTEQMEKLELDVRMPRTDVRVLDPCQVRK